MTGAIFISDDLVPYLCRLRQFISYLSHISEECFHWPFCSSTLLTGLGTSTFCDQDCLISLKKYTKSYN